MNELHAAVEAETARLDEIHAQFGHLPEVAALVTRVRQLLAAGARVVQWSGKWRPPGRLGHLIDDLGASLIDSAFRAPGVNASTWTGHEWRRRALALRVPKALLLQEAVRLANEAGVTKPRDLDAIPPEIADDLVDALEQLAERSARDYARKVIES